MVLFYFSQASAPGIATETFSNPAWLLLATALVLLMQAGFLLLESGMARTKNAVAVAQKNLADLCLSIGAFALIGFPLMFGPSLGWFGWSPLGSLLGEVNPTTLAFFAFQAVFAGTAATIMSGAVAERMRLGAYMVMAFCLAGFLYPLFGHWVWGNLLTPDNPSWLADHGFMDFAGGTVVHAAGGWFAMGVILVLGSRIGRFDSTGAPRRMQGHSLVLSAVGALILLFGWFGFNAGSGIGHPNDIAIILANTLMAAVAGGSLGMFLGWGVDRAFLPHRTINGMLGGLVGLTASCAYVDLQSAVLIGALCGALSVVAEDMILRVLRLDDVVGAVTVHGVCGAAGALLLAGFVPLETLAAGSRLAQLSIQAQGVALNFVLFFGAGAALAFGIKQLGLLRVDPADEMCGLSLTEHGVEMTSGSLQEALVRITLIDRDLSVRLQTDGGDEAAEIAMILNPFLSEMQTTLGSVRTHASQVSDSSLDLRSLSLDCADESARLSTTSKLMQRASAGLHHQADQAADTVTDAGQQANFVADKATAMASDMADMAVTVEHMAGTVSQIAADATEARRASTTAMESASDSLSKITTLAQTTQAVDEVMAQITEISEKTIILAMNARVEAARSGEAGRGFAIVAQEVADLSRDTQDAAESISKRINDMKDGSLEALKGMRAVSDVLRALNQNMVGVSQATGSQTSSIDELKAVSQAGAQRAEDLAQNASALKDDTDRIAAFAESVRQGSSHNAQLADDMQHGAERGKDNAEKLAQTSGDLARDSQHLSAATRRYRA